MVDQKGRPALWCLMTLACSIAFPTGCARSGSANQADGGSEDTDSNDADDDENDDSDEDSDDGDDLDDFFGLRVHEVEIEVDEQGVQALLDEPKVYTVGAVRIDGTRYDEVGVRLKGGAGSFIPLDGDYPDISGDGNCKPGKSAFIIDFNRYVSGQNHLGLEKLTINNMVQDPSCIHEFLGYALFREGSVPASRSSWAIVWFNREHKGLYALIETPDNDEFLQKWFGADDGNLYEGAYGADLVLPGNPDDMEWWFDQDNGQDTSMTDLFDLIAALDAIGDDEDAVHVLDARFDLDEYLAFAATELFLGQWDGYAWSVNNYAIHHDLAADRWTFLPWGIDQLFEDELGPFAGVFKSPGPAWEWGGRVHRVCFTSAACRSRLAQAFVRLLERVDRMDLVGLAGQARELVQELALAESTEFGDPDLTIASLDRVIRFILERRGAIAAWLPCLTGQKVDNDQDGFDGCKEDCDDRNPSIHPGAQEPCDFADNDCNGVIDDPPECPKCIGPEIGPDGLERHFCFERRTWEEARQHCLENGWELASTHSPEVWEFVTFGLIFMGLEELWIGLNDRDAELDFRWTDNSELDYLHWSSGCPKEWEEGEVCDCAVTSPWGWHDIPCDHRHPFVCQTGPLF